MAVTRSRPDEQLALDPSQLEPPARSGQGASAPNALPSTIWWDARDHVWRGLVPALSLFAEADRNTEVRALLAEKVATYIEDAVEQGLEQELIPRPLSSEERRKLRWYLRSLRLRAWLARVFPLAPRFPVPVVEDVSVYWRR